VLEVADFENVGKTFNLPCKWLGVWNNVYFWKAASGCIRCGHITGRHYINSVMSALMGVENNDAVRKVVVSAYVAMHMSTIIHCNTDISMSDVGELFWCCMWLCQWCNFVGDGCGCATYVLTILHHNIDIGMSGVGELFLCCKWLCYCQWLCWQCDCISDVCGCVSTVSVL
jgi:hypothetical protein